MQPACGSQVSWVHTTPSSQSSGVPFTHSPVVGSQVSAPSQASPLSQSRRRWSQMCCSTSQLSVVQVPRWQVSVWVQALPSLHAVPLLAFGLEHWPVAVLQVPATWHWSSAVQTTGFEPVQVPLWQVSVWVQALPSLHAVPLPAFGLEHWPVAVLELPATWHRSSAV